MRRPHSPTPDGIKDSVIQLSNNDSVTVAGLTGLSADDFIAGIDVC
jgi:hypothetical protein